MLFNSIEFFIFFTIVLSLYYLFPHRWQNRLLLAASYFFYGWWDWRFLALLLVSTLLDYVCGWGIARSSTQPRKNAYLVASIVGHLTLLGFFKYWNFFTESLLAILTPFGIHADFLTLHIILPVGISFYTFQAMTYSFDIYYEELKPTSDFLDFALFVAFFPQLIAGPIERAQNILPQIRQKRQYQATQLSDGLRLIFWGLFEKVFVADNLAPIVNQYYGQTDATGWQYLLATFAFAFQIYGDFSGYSHIARGTAKCLGIELMVNFNAPYLAMNPADFWQRWHISLSSWFRDYLYMPLAFSNWGRVNPRRQYMIVMIVFSITGLWHGAAWNFVLWGGYHGLLLCIFRFLGRASGSKKLTPARLLPHTLDVLVMFTLTCISWVLFRAQSFQQILHIFRRILTGPWHFAADQEVLFDILFLIAIPCLVMLWTYLKSFDLFPLQSPIMIAAARSPILKSIAYGILTYLLCFYAAHSQSFIYLQF